MSSTLSYIIPREVVTLRAGGLYLSNGRAEVVDKGGSVEIKGKRSWQYPTEITHHRVCVTETAACTTCPGAAAGSGTELPPELVECLELLKDYLEPTKLEKYPVLPGFYVNDTGRPYCGQFVHWCIEDGTFAVFDLQTQTFQPIGIEQIMARTIGQNPATLNKVSRQFTCEIKADGADEVVTNATIMALLAGLPYPAAPGVTVDAASAYLNEISVGLASLGDEGETSGGEVMEATNCDASALDVDADKVTNLEPGGNWGFEYMKGVDVQPFEITVKDGSVISICGEVSACLTKAGDAAIPKP
jgi:hypothetical protein